MNLVTVSPENKESIIAIFKSNMPRFFDPSEEKPFVDFLEKYLSTYYAVMDNGSIVGAGGYMELEPGEARICWLMIEAKHHGKGIGKYLMEELEKRIRLDATQYTRITLKTTQFTDQFYEKLSYQTTHFEKDFWVPGWDLYFMEKPV